MAKTATMILKASIRYQADVEYLAIKINDKGQFTFNFAKIERKP